MIVIDASALVIAVVDTTDRGVRVRAALTEGAVAPHLLDAEVGQTLRGLALRQSLNPGEAERSLQAAEDLVVERFAHPPLRRRVWELRHSVSYYDGLYVALAEALALELVTADARLARSDGPRCPIVVV